MSDPEQEFFDSDLDFVLHSDGYFESHLLGDAVEPIACGVSFNDRIRQSQSKWSLFNATWQKRRRGLENRLSFETEEMTPQMQ